MELQFLFPEIDAQQQGWTSWIIQNKNKCDKT